MSHTHEQLVKRSRQLFPGSRVLSYHDTPDYNRWRDKMLGWFSERLGDLSRDDRMRTSLMVVQRMIATYTGQGRHEDLAFSHRLFQELSHYAARLQQVEQEPIQLSLPDAAPATREGVRG